MPTEPMVELFVDAHAIVGECPVWDSQKKALYWIDVKAPALYRTEADRKTTVAWRLPSEVGGFALTTDGTGVIIALRSGLFRLDLSSNVLGKLADAPFDPRTHRFNEVDCDPTGRLWLGVMFEPEPKVQAKPQPGAIYSFTASTGLVAHSDYALTPNGFAWSLDARTVYIAHSEEARIEAVEFDPKRGTLGRRQTLARVEHDLGVPDGGAVDAEGHYWSAIHGGGVLRRYSPDGRIDRELFLPIKNPTMLAFGGSTFEDVYVTSASHGSLGDLEGSVFRLRPGVGGRLRPRFSST